MASSLRGLSPLARGNPHLAVAVRLVAGPIPARAGQPDRAIPVSGRMGAYPRSRGATARQRLAVTNVQGLSPLARGNRSAAAGRTRFGGPIPARAGQPCRSGPCRHALRAYPRSRGATSGWLRAGLSERGLSPLARGNRHGARLAFPYVGPIPARAGQPARAWVMGIKRRAYPRSRGATPSQVSLSPSEGGLSPLARGNRRRCNG